MSHAIFGTYLHLIDICCLTIIQIELGTCGLSGNLICKECVLCDFKVLSSSPGHCFGAIIWTLTIALWRLCLRITVHMLLVLRDMVFHF